MQIQLDVDLLKTFNVHFCIPCYGGQISEQTFMGIVKWGQEASKLGISWTMETLVNESLISRGRNTLAARFLHNEKTTHLFFIDADIGFDPWHVLTVLNHNKDVVCGLYPMKQLPLQWVVNSVPGSDETPRDDFLVEVSKSGTGFMCIKEHVFEELKQHPAVKPFNNDIGLPKELDPYMYTYFDSAVRDNRYYSEDWTFCENWRDIGGKVWVDSRILLKHTGHFNFCHENDTAIRKLYETTPPTVQTKLDTELQAVEDKPETTPSKKKKGKAKK